MATQRSDEGSSALSTSSGSTSSGSTSAGSGASSGSSDPDAIAAEIERTREDLAETLDAIADRVSPKRVAERGRAQLGETVRHAKETLAEKTATAKVVVAEKAAAAKQATAERSATAKEVVADRTATAKGAVADKTATAKGAVADKTATAKGAVADKTATAKQAVAERRSGDSDSPETVPAVAVVAVPAGTLDGTADLPPVSGVEVPGLAPSSSAPAAGPLDPVIGGSSTYVSSAPAVKKELVAGVVVALVGLWLLRRRRS